MMESKKTTTNNVFPWAPEIPHKGRIRAQADLAKSVWFRVGGAADFLFSPADEEDLVRFLMHKPKDILVTTLGRGSNVLIRDGGIEGVVVRLGPGFNTLKQADNLITVGAACFDATVAQYCAEKGLTGAEFLAGVPGSIGGAVMMNAGAYGQSISDIIQTCKGIMPNGDVRTFTKEEMRFDYRKSFFPTGFIITEATFLLTQDGPDAITARIQEIMTQRATSQPIKTQTGGSTFKNPAGHKAWELVDGVGMRGAIVGGGQVSELHCNFLTNTGSATAADLETLGENIRKAVQEKYGISLEWEIKRLGRQRS